MKKIFKNFVILNLFIICIRIVFVLFVFWL